MSDNPTITYPFGRIEKLIREDVRKTLGHQGQINIKLDYRRKTKSADALIELVAPSEATTEIPTTQEAPAPSELEQDFEDSDQEALGEQTEESDDLEEAELDEPVDEQEEEEATSPDEEEAEPTKGNSLFGDD